jgi:hypothetical protein
MAVQRDASGANGKASVTVATGFAVLLQALPPIARTGECVEIFQWPSNLPNVRPISNVWQCRFERPH